MSRIGKKVIPVPEGVEVTVSGGELTVKGKKGTLKEPWKPGIQLEKNGNVIQLKRSNETPEIRSLHGTLRNILASMMRGVSQGFQKKLNIVGVGYKAEVKGKNLVLALGFSHPIDYAIPEGIQITYEKNSNSLVIAGCDRRLVGQVASDIRDFRPPEPYKGKGVMYDGEKIRRKVGKTGGK